jgi:hypothetical protein
MKCIENKVHLSQYLIEINRDELSNTIGEDRVIRWCSNCGRLAYCTEIDGRIFGKVEFKLPKGE